jgi:hypothetical protein
MNYEDIEIDMAHDVRCKKCYECATSVMISAKLTDAVEILSSFGECFAVARAAGAI